MITSFTSVGTVYEQEDVGETRDGAARGAARHGGRVQVQDN